MGICTVGQIEAVMPWYSLSPNSAINQPMVISGYHLDWIHLVQVISGLIAST
jgi:hypothetical protein